jgi:hypothetical protein
MMLAPLEYLTPTDPFTSSLYTTTQFGSRNMPQRSVGRFGKRGDDDDDEGLAMSKKLRTSIDAGPA